MKGETDHPKAFHRRTSSHLRPPKLPDRPTQPRKLQTCVISPVIVPRLLPILVPLPIVTLSVLHSFAPPLLLPPLPLQLGQLSPRVALSLPDLFHLVFPCPMLHRLTRSRFAVRSASPLLWALQLAHRPQLSPTRSRQERAQSTNSADCTASRAIRCPALGPHTAGWTYWRCERRCLV